MATKMKFISRIIIVCVVWQTSSTQETIKETQLHAPPSAETKTSSTITTSSTLVQNILPSTTSSLLSVPGLEPQRVIDSVLTRTATTEKVFLMGPLNSATRAEHFVQTSSSTIKFVVKDLSLPTTNTTLGTPLLKKPNHMLKIDGDPVESVIILNNDAASVPVLKPIPSAPTIPFFIDVDPNGKSSSERILIVASFPSAVRQLDPPQLQAPQKISSDTVVASLLSSSANPQEDISISLKEGTALMSLPSAKSVTISPVRLTQTELTSHTSTFTAQITTPTPAQQPSLSLLPPDSTTQSVVLPNSSFPPDQRPVWMSTSLTPVAVSPLIPSTSLLPLITTIVTPTTMPSASTISYKPNKIRKFPKYRFKTKRRRITTKNPEVAYTVRSPLPPSTPFAPVTKAAFPSKPLTSNALPIMPSNDAQSLYREKLKKGGHFFKQVMKTLVDD